MLKINYNKKYFDFFFEYFEKGTIPSVFKSIISSENKSPFLNENYEKASIKKTIYSVFFIPDYLKPTFDTQIFAFKKINQFFKGYAIFLNGFESVDSYIKFRFRKNAKSINKRIKRLETCFDIHYKMFYGNIDQGEYKTLMNILHDFLVNRFEERNDTSQTLLNWDRYFNMYHELINNKQASLFVIYSNQEPIVISLSHHSQNKLFSAISSYDIDYSKFSLGNVEIYQKLKWCTENNHNVYELGMGDLNYKREWSNHVYDFEHHIYYPRKSLLAYSVSLIMYVKAYFKELIFKLFYVRYKKFKTNRKKTKPLVRSYRTILLEQLDISNLTPIDFTEKEYQFLKKPIYDFLYSSIDHVSNVSAYLEDQNSYIIKGKNKICKIEYDK